MSAQDRLFNEPAEPETIPLSRVCFDGRYNFQESADDFTMVERFYRIDGNADLEPQS